MPLLTRYVTSLASMFSSAKNFMLGEGDELFPRQAFYGEVQGRLDVATRQGGISCQDVVNALSGLEHLQAGEGIYHIFAT